MADVTLTDLRTRPVRTTNYRVVLIDDHPLFAESLDLALSRSGYDVRRAEIPDTPTRTATLLAQSCRRGPSVVLLDLDLGRFGDGSRLIRPLVQIGATVVVLTAETDRARWGQCISEGAATVLSKTGALDTVLATLGRIEEGLPVLAAGEREGLLASWRVCQAEQQALRSRLDRLTVRESEVLGGLARGRTVREIATRSFVSEATVRTQVKSILGKLCVSSQLAAVGLARSASWRPPLEGHP